MDWIWTLAVCLGVVCSAVPGLTQSSSKTLFLISGPEVLHAGIPTPLAITVLADFSVRVMAEVEYDNNTVSQTEDFQGGLTRVLTLPPIPASITQSSLLNLTVRGYKGDKLIFTNTTSLSFNLRNVYSSIQMDRLRYQAGETVKVRIVSVRLDNHPYKGRVEISIRDTSGNAVERWESTGNLGIVSREFSLSQTSPLGQWAITVTVNGVTDEKTFIVEHHDSISLLICNSRILESRTNKTANIWKIPTCFLQLRVLQPRINLGSTEEEPPPFEVLVKTPSQVLVGNDISGSVRALYPSGQPVQGTLAVSLTLTPAMDNSTSAFTLTQTKEIYGSTQFFFSKAQLYTLHTASGPVVMYVTACVNSTGQVNKTVEVHLMKNTFQLEFYDFPLSLKPSLHFSTKLRVSRYDRKPLSSLDRMSSAVVEITQRKSMMDPEPTIVILPIPEDGNVHIEFKLQADVVMLFIRARFQSSEETLKVYNNYSSPNSSYIQISPTLPAQIGLALQLDVESTFQPAELHFVVSSRGQVVAAGTKNSSSFSLTPTVSWSPEVCVTVYCILSDGEVTSDTAYLTINQHGYVSLKWGSDKAQPGEQVSLTATVLGPKSQVAVTVMGMHDEAPQADLDLKVGRECNIRMLTNAKLYKKKQPDGPKDEMGSALMVEKYSHWMTDAAELFLWLDVNLSDSTRTSWEIKVPDGITALRAVAQVMSENLGFGFTPVPQKLTVSKDFSLSLDVPSYLIRGEEIVLEVNIINHLEQDIEVIVLLAESEAFEFVLADRGDVSVVNAQRFILGSHVSASALFPIRPVALGEMEISVDAISMEASDSLVWRVLVKPEGVEQFFSETLFLELGPVKHNNSSSVSFSFPPDVVPGSRRAHVALVGDILVLSINNLHSLVQIPVGCGEQNIIHFAPSIYVLQYLEKSMQDDQIRSRALDYMKEGYQRQLSYKRADGSFSAFGPSDTSGSTWLTAFVLRCFLQAQPFMQIDQSVLTGAMTWLLGHQGPQGEFNEVGRLIHTEMQGGLDNGTVALTAYVLMALLEDDTYVDMFPANVSLAQKYLESRVSSGGVSNYSLCLVAYALALANSPVAASALAELSSRADYKDGVMMWSSSAGLDSHDWQPRSAQIEMTSYVLLALFRRGNLVEGITLMKWLSKQRNHLGGYGTTQDTVIALQALANYAAISGSNAINLRLNISSPTSSMTFPINSTNFRMYQSREINADKDLNMNIYMEGRGFAVFQMNIFYNLESKAFLQNLQHSTDQEAFLLGVEVTHERDHNHMLLSICTGLKHNQVISQTGMVILDVGMLSGFSLSPKAGAPIDLIRKVEILPEKVSLYLQSLTKSEVCIRLPVIRDYKVARVQDAVVQVYDYYEPKRRARRTYNSKFLNNMHSCFFCGKDCDRCRPGITITLPPSSTSHAISSSAFSSLSCLLLGVTAYFHCSLIL